MVKINTWAVLALLLTLTLTLTLCMSSCMINKTELDYRDRHFSCTARFCQDGREIIARTELGAVSNGERDIRMELLYPEELLGIKLVRMGGRTYAEYREMRIETDAFGELTSWAQMLVPEGEIRTCRRVSDGVFYIVVKKGEEAHEIYLDAEGCTPTEIRSGGRTAYITEFSFLPQG